MPQKSLNFVKTKKYMRTKLIEGLKRAIYALQKDTVIYNWETQSSCNCGVVAQAMTGLPPQQIKKKFREMRELYETTSTMQEFKHTWKEGVQYTCSVTGKTESEILTLLINEGLLPEDLIHLEYLDNPAILTESGIEIYEETQSVAKNVSVPRTDFWGKLLKLSTVTVVYENIGVHFYTKKENLILYLQAWVRILEKEPYSKPLKDLSKVELQEQLLRCEHAENYEEAAKLRDLISASV